MPLSNIVERSDTVLGLTRDLRKLVYFLRRDRRVAARYLQSHTLRKLQIGAGPNRLPGWLATDVAPAGRDVAYLDATRRFPFADATFAYVFSEHMIEHITWPQGQHMLRECLRVLQPGGVLRVATPDLAVLIGLYDRDRSAAADRYIAWITDAFLPDVGVHKAPFVINNNVRAWGHQFLYDGEILETAMREAGFVDIVRRAPGQSAHDELQGIESHGVVVDNEEMSAFETMVYEGTRPG